MFPALAALAMLLRVGLGLSKYLVWAVMACVVQYARRATPIVPAAQRVEVPAWFWPVAAAAMLASAFGLFVYRNAQRRAAKAAAAGAEGAPNAAEDVPTTPTTLEAEKLVKAE